MTNTQSPAPGVAAEIERLMALADNFAQQFVGPYSVGVAVAKREALQSALRTALQASAAAVEPVAWVVWWGIGDMQKNSVHFERKTAEEVAAGIKSVTEIRPLYTAPPLPSPAPQAAGAGLSLTQESKYTISGNSIVNRASGEAIPPDEPIFIFRARDRQACSILGEYAQLCENAAHREAVNERFIQFGEWAEANPDRMKEPDTAAITASGRDAS